MKILLEIYDKTVWENSGWYIDDGLGNRYIKGFNELMSGASR
jgi:hypothetical protein